jgi:hypothetical protein
MIFFIRIQSLQNLGLAVMINISGVIVDKGGYLLLEVFFLAWLFGKLLQKYNDFQFQLFFIFKLLQFHWPRC